MYIHNCFNFRIFTNHYNKSSTTKESNLLKIKIGFIERLLQELLILTITRYIGYKYTKFLLNTKQNLF